MNIRRKHAFTLVEALFGIVILGIVSTSSWYAVNTLFHTGALTQSRNQGVNLLQRSQEEVRKASRSFFDSLNNCQFPGSGTSNSTCGFSDTSTTFPGYTRSLTVTSEDGNTELKKAVITVEWDEFNQHKTMQSAVLIARPPDPFPGNIIGTIRSCKDNNIIVGGATVVAVSNSGLFSRTNVSTNAVGAKNANYDFQDQTNGHFLLPVGTYKITATSSKFKAYPGPGTTVPQITVGTNSEAVFNFCMEPNPSDAKLSVRLVNSANGNSLLPHFMNPMSSNYWGHIRLYDNGAQYLTVPKVSTTTFTIPFTTTDPKVFTLFTDHAFHAGYAYKNTSSGSGVCALPYSPEGWSSALIQEDGSETCGNPYYGNTASDRITINPGDELSIDIPLVPVPKATIKGRVVDSNGDPVAGAQVQAVWPTIANVGTTVILWTSFATTNAEGDYTYTVPAVQDLFADSPPNNYLQVYANGDVLVKNCCHQNSKANVRSQNTEFVGPLFEGTVKTGVDFIIPISDKLCGNAQGKISDGLTGSGISSALVTIQGASEDTDSVGDYVYQCDGDESENGFRLPSGAASVLSAKGGYYSFTTAGNTWYAASSGVTILAGQMVDYNAKLWPMGSGNLDVTVINNGNNLPISNARVDLLTYAGTHIVLTTDSEGKAIFQNVMETWPPVNLPADLYYKHNVLSHSLTTTHPSGVFSSDLNHPITDLQRNNTMPITIRLNQGGGT